MSRIQSLLMTVTTMTARIEEGTLELGAAVQAKADKEAAVMADRPTDPMDRQEMTTKVMQEMRGRKDVKGERSPTDLLRLTHPVLMMGAMAMLEMVMGA